MNDRAVGDLLAFDPSLNAPGAALLRSGRIVAAELVKIDPDYVELDLLERCNRVAAAVVRWGMAYDMEPRWLIVEWPQWYPGERSMVDPNSLAGMVGICGALMGQLSIALAMRDIALEGIRVKPAEVWGNLPKDTTIKDGWASPRGQRIRSRLGPEELRSVQNDHNAIDAAGIGLWAVGRWERLRVLPGAV